LLLKFFFSVNILTHRTLLQKALKPAEHTSKDVLAAVCRDQVLCCHKEEGFVRAQAFFIKMTAKVPEAFVSSPLLPFAVSGLTHTAAYEPVEFDASSL